jgi:hypothetical protein
VTDQDEVFRKTLENSLAQLNVEHVEILVGGICHLDFFITYLRSQERACETAPEK